jgi:hypothetical protein
VWAASNQSHASKLRGLDSVNPRHHLQSALVCLQCKHSRLPIILTSSTTSLKCHNMCTDAACCEQHGVCHGKRSCDTEYPAIGVPTLVYSRRANQSSTTERLAQLTLSVTVVQGGHTCLSTVA